jgi:serine/threonine protein kinase
MTTTSHLGKLGKYELLEKIGEGGFGIVYKARDPLLEREVAIKILRMDIAGAPDFVERFHREARLAASLRHPNIVTVIEVGEQEGRYYLVMEYLEGEVLSELLKPGQPLPLQQAVQILKPLAEALDYAHGRGLVHRDVKPSNIILSDGGKRPVLTDFGLVKSMTEGGLTTTGVTLGTVEYMAPEQITGQEVGPTSDLYALGVIAYQMLTGRVPFTGRTPFEIQMGHVQQAPPPPRTLNPAMPEALAQVLTRALAKKQAFRYQSGAELVAALEQSLPQPTPPPTAVRPVTPPAVVAQPVTPSAPVVPESRRTPPPRLTPVPQPAELSQLTYQPQPADHTEIQPPNTKGMLLTIGIGVALFLLYWLVWSLVWSLVYPGFTYVLICLSGILAFLIAFIPTFLVARRVLHHQRVPRSAILVYLLGMFFTPPVGFVIGSIAADLVLSILSWLACGALTIFWAARLWKRSK